MEQYVIFWVIAATAFVVLEVVTVAFVALYVALGSVAAAIVAGAGGELIWQLLAFVIAGVVLTRPVLKGKLEGENVATNVDRMVGKSGIVTIAVDNDANTGQIRVGTEYWTARLPEESTVGSVPVDGRVSIVAIEGVTARVLPKVAPSE
jgi:membrane protein implicated in regulation of membrane protease activity